MPIDFPDMHGQVYVWWVHVSEVGAQDGPRGHTLSGCIPTASSTDA